MKHYTVLLAGNKVTRIPFPDERQSVDLAANGWGPFLTYTWYRFGCVFVPIDLGSRAVSSDTFPGKTAVKSFRSPRTIHAFRFCVILLGNPNRVIDCVVLRWVERIRISVEPNRRNVVVFCCVYCTRGWKLITGTKNICLWERNSYVLSFEVGRS